MDYISTWMGDRLDALLVSLMALQLVLVDQNPLRPFQNVLLLVNSTGQFVTTGEGMLGVCHMSSQSNPSLHLYFSLSFTNINNSLQNTKEHSENTHLHQGWRV